MTLKSHSEVGGVRAHGARTGGKALLCALAMGISGAAAGEAVTAPVERELALSIYRDGVALVQDRRTVSFPTDAYRLEWPGVAPALQRDTVRFGSRKRALEGYRVRQRPVSMDALLQAYAGRIVRVEQDGARGTTRADALLVSADPPLVSVDGQVRGVDPAELVFPEGLPAHLGGVPALELEVGRVPEPGTATGADSAMVSYLSDGFSWSADYTATIEADDDQLDLVARATIDNRSGMAVTEASAELIAGRLSVPREPQPTRGRFEAALAADTDAPASEPLGHLRRFALDAPITVADGERYSRRLFVHGGIPLQQRYVLEAHARPMRDASAAGWEAVPLTTELEWTSEQGALPAGTVRVYRRDRTGAVRFVGGDRIEDRPRGQQVRIAPGQPFDITARRRQTAFERLEPRVHEVGHTIELHNQRASPASVRVEEAIAGDWRITETNHPWERASAQMAVWQLELAPGETRELRYRARIEQ